MIQIRSRAYHKNTDTYTMSEMGIPGIVLMERAAYSLVQEVTMLINKTDRIIAVCGSGNNGGDGIAAARILHIMGYQCDVLLFRGEHGVTPETKQQLSIAENVGVTIYDSENIDVVQFSAYHAIIDAIFGIGVSREVLEPYRSAIQRINDSGALIIAADIPSGIDADTGAILGVAIKAEITVSFGYGKPGLFLYPGAEHAGRIVVTEIGFVAPKKPEYEMFAYENLQELPLLRRRADSHKGSYGKVLLIAGFGEMSGACCMAAEAAYRCGAGLVRVVTSEDSKRTLQARTPELMVSSYEKSDWECELSEQIAWADVIAIGPGIGMGDDAKRALELVLSSQKKLVLDADALNLLDGDLNRIPKGAVLTPHPVELSRLLCLPIEEIKKDRIGVLQNYGIREDIVLVCKDARTIIAQGKRFCINLNGNSGMATGGSGDVLSGILAAMLASGLDTYEAACSAVRIHAEAGDAAANDLSEHSMLATDIIARLPDVFHRIEENMN